MGLIYMLYSILKVNSITQSLANHASAENVERIIALRQHFEIGL